MKGEVQQQIETLEDALPLTPPQQGVRMQSLYAQPPGAEIEQIICHLHEDLKAPAFERAWQRIVEGHARLRTSWRWEQGQAPLQEVYRHVRLHWENKDWRGLTAGDQTYRLEAYLAAERRRGFALTAPPLMRLALIRLAETDYQLVWTFHHLLLDARALTALLNEVFTFYEAFRQGLESVLEPPRSERDYLQWLEERNLAQTEAFWPNALQGFSTPTSLLSDAARNRILAE